MYLVAKLSHLTSRGAPVARLAESRSERTLSTIADRLPGCTASSSADRRLSDALWRP